MLNGWPLRSPLGAGCGRLYVKQTPFTQRANDSTNLYILNLAFCDFLFCLVVAPLFMLHFVYKGWPLGKAAKMGPTENHL